MILFRSACELIGSDGKHLRMPTRDLYGRLVHSSSFLGSHQYEEWLAVWGAILGWSDRVPSGAGFRIPLPESKDAFRTWFWDSALRLSLPPLVLGFGNASAASHIGTTRLILGLLAAAAWGAHIEADVCSRFLRGTDAPIRI